MELAKDFQGLEQYLEPYELNQAVVAKTVVIRQGKSGDIVAAQSWKLSNIVLNLKTSAVALDLNSLIKYAIQAMSLVEVAEDFVSGDVSDETVLSALKFLGSALELTEIGIGKQQANALLALHKLEAKGSELTSQIVKNQLSISGDILEDLIDLRCIRRKGGQLLLVEKVILQQVNE